MSTSIKFTPGVLGTECFPTHQAFYNKMIEVLSGTLPDASVKYIVSDTAPGPDDQDKLWIKTSSGAPLRQYIFYNGAWSWPHELPAGDSRVQIYKGSAASIDTLDGGTAAAVGDASGPFWEIDTDLSARMPLGVGTLESGAAVAVGDTGGEEKHVLTEAELPEHSHNFTLNKVANHDSFTDPPSQLIGSNINPQTANTTPDVSISGGGSGEGHNNLPPYYGVYFIKRTARIYYTG